MNECTELEYQELLDLSADGVLNRAETHRLEAHLRSCAPCRTEREDLVRLGDVLRASRIEVDPGFQERVMAELQPTGWEARSPRSWAWAVGICALLGGTAAILAGSSAAHLTPAGSFLSAFAAVLGLFKASMLAGAGLLGASWRGLGLGVQELLSGSPANLVALAAVVVGCNLVFFRLLQNTVLAVEQKRLGSSARGSDSVGDGTPSRDDA